MKVSLSTIPFLQLWTNRYSLLRRVILFNQGERTGLKEVSFVIIQSIHLLSMPSSTSNHQTSHNLIPHTHTHTSNIRFDTTPSLLFLSSIRQQRKRMRPNIKEAYLPTQNSRSVPPMKHPPNDCSAQPINLKYPFMQRVQTSRGSFSLHR